jgi:hypothetical protein
MGSIELCLLCRGNSLASLLYLQLYKGGGKKKKEEKEKKKRGKKSINSV